MDREGPQLELSRRKQIEHPDQRVSWVHLSEAGNASLADGIGAAIREVRAAHASGSR